MATLASLSLHSAPCAGVLSRNSSTSSRSNHRVLRIEANKRAKKIRQVILREDLQGIGSVGDQVKVKAGFYRNYLLPTGKADILSAKMLKEMQMEKDRIEAEKRRVKEDAEQLAAVLQSIGPFKVRRKTTIGKLISGSVSSQDVADIIKSQVNRDIEKDNVIIPEINEIGEYIAEVILHEDVSARVRVNVTAS
ncbi:hypothetical protein LUZ60_006925 [Juncus effusus]|nr:hypothetical protein LUZ60_006925 [Juncus effusus]